MNLVEMVADEQRPAPCKYGNIVEGHACYCHHPDAWRKCPQWKYGEPYEDCEYFEKRESEDMK